MNIQFHTISRNPMKIFNPIYDVDLVGNKSSTCIVSNLQKQKRKNSLEKIPGTLKKKT